MRKIHNPITLMFFIIIVTNCDRIDTQLLIQNRTAKPVYYYVKFDTVLDIGKNLSRYKIGSYDSTRPRLLIGGSGVWAHYINNQSKDSTLHIYFFTSELITTDIIKSKEYKRVDLKIRDLDKLNWNVDYFE